MRTVLRRAMRHGLVPLLYAASAKRQAPICPRGDRFGSEEWYSLRGTNLTGTVDFAHNLDRIPVSPRPSLGRDQGRAPKDTPVRGSLAEGPGLVAWHCGKP